jgi:hypothetical protein
MLARTARLRPATSMMVLCYPSFSFKSLVWLKGWQREQTTTLYPTSRLISSGDMTFGQIGSLQEYFDVCLSTKGGQIAIIVWLPIVVVALA